MEYQGPRAGQFFSFHYLIDLPGPHLRGSESGWRVGVYYKGEFPEKSVNDRNSWSVAKVGSRRVLFNSHPFQAKKKVYEYISVKDGIIPHNFAIFGCHAYRSGKKNIRIDHALGYFPKPKGCLDWGGGGGVVLSRQMENVSQSWRLIKDY